MIASIPAARESGFLAVTPVLARTVRPLGAADFRLAYGDAMSDLPATWRPL